MFFFSFEYIQFQSCVIYIRTSSFPKAGLHIICFLYLFPTCYFYLATLILLHLSCYIYLATFILLHLSCYIYVATFIFLLLSCYIYIATFILLHLYCYFYLLTFILLHLYCYFYLATFILSQFKRLTSHEPNLIQRIKLTRSSTFESIRFGILTPVLNDEQLSHRISSSTVRQ